MNNILNRFRKRNIQTNLYHFVLVIFVIAVSVCLISGLFINYLTLDRSVNKFLDNSNLPSLWLETSSVTSSDENFLSSKFDFDKRYSFDSDFKIGSSDYFGTFLVSNGKTSTPYIVEGEKEKGCYVDIRFAEKHRLSINYSKITFDYELNGVTKSLEFKVAGFITLAEDLIVHDDCLTFIDENVFLEALKSNFDGIETADLSIIDYNQILIKSEVSENDISQIESFYETSSSSLQKIEKRENLLSIVSINKEIQTAKNMLWIFPIIFVIISILVIVSAISQLTIKERYNIGLLKSLGITNKQIILNYCGYGSFIGFFGAIFGFIFSPLIIPNIIFEAYDKIYNLPRDEMNLTCPIELVIFVIIASVIICFLSALFVCLNLTKKTPKECMNALPKVGLKSRKKKNNLPVIINAPFRNMKINLIRTCMSLLGVAGCSLLMIIGFGIENQLLTNSETNNLYIIQAFSNVFKGFSITLMILTITILIVQIFKERLKEMAVRRIHGESYVNIWLSVLIEMIGIGFIGYLLSVILSWPTMLLNVHIFGINKYLFISFFSFLKTFLILMLTIIITSLFGLVKIYKLRLSESIKFSE